MYIFCFNLTAYARARFNAFNTVARLRINEAVLPNGISRNGRTQTVGWSFIRNDSRSILIIERTLCRRGEGMAWREGSNPFYEWPI